MTLSLKIRLIKCMHRVKENHKMLNYIDTLITMKDLKEDNKDDINIIKEECGVLFNIHGTRHHKTTL
jgi:hypothetical protein